MAKLHQPTGYKKKNKVTGVWEFFLPPPIDLSAKSTTRMKVLNVCESMKSKKAKKRRDDERGA